MVDSSDGPCATRSTGDRGTGELSGRGARGTGCAEAAVSDRGRRSGRARDRARVRVELGARGYDILVGAGCWPTRATQLKAARRVQRAFVVTDETVAALHLPAPAGGAGARPASRTPDRRAAAGRGEQGFAGPRDSSARGRAGARHRARDRGRGARRRRGRRPRRLRRRDRCCAASTSCSCRPRCSPRSTARSAARPRSTAGTARTWSAPSTSRAWCWPTSTLLDTLPRRELLAGYAEVVKYGLIGDAAVLRLARGSTARR